MIYLIYSQLLPFLFWYFFNMYTISVNEEIKNYPIKYDCYVNFSDSNYDTEEYIIWGIYPESDSCKIIKIQVLVKDLNFEEIFLTLIHELLHYQDELDVVNKLKYNYLTEEQIENKSKIILDSLLK